MGRDQGEIQGQLLAGQERQANDFNGKTGREIHTWILKHI